VAKQTATDETKHNRQEKQHNRREEAATKPPTTCSRPQLTITRTTLIHMSLATTGQKDPDEGSLITVEGRCYNNQRETCRRKSIELDLQTTPDNTSDGAAT